MDSTLDATTTRETAIEVSKVLDALAALSYDISCHDDIPDDELVLPAGRVRETCGAIREAVTALKRILLISEQHGGGVIPKDVLQRIRDTGSRDTRA